MKRFKINGISVSAPDGSTVLDAAREHDVFVPALCYHKAVSAYGACRLCLVGLELNGRKRVIASCSYLVEDDIQIDTNDPNAVKSRNMAMELLLARCPGNRELEKLALRMGIRETRFIKRNEQCILCGLCVRVCQEVIGNSSISFTGRGSERRVATPYDKPGAACNGCGACAAVCPVNAIQVLDDGSSRVLPELKTVVRRHACEQCGQYFATDRQVMQVLKAFPAMLSWSRLCPDCRRSLAAHIRETGRMHRSESGQ